MRLLAALSRLIHPRRATLFPGIALALMGLPLSAQTVVSIHDIMVASGNTYVLPDSPYLYTHYGANVSVSGIVVGVMSTGDFTGTVYISEPSTSWDSAVSTAEGMPVFGVATLNPACAVVGNTITVVGQVVESNTVVPADITAANTPGTGVLPTTCTVTATGGTMTQSISLGTTLNSFGGALEYTGMTTSATFYAVAPATGTLAEATETATSTGQFWATLSTNTATNNHLFRTTGIAKDEYTPTAAPTTVATWTGNPQRILIDTTTFGGSPVNLTVGQTITCTTGSNIQVGATAGIGLIDYILGYARLLIFPTSVCTVGETVSTTTSATADSTHFHVGTLDLDRFYSTTAATPGSVAISSSAYTRRLNKAALAIVNALGTPDILSLQEVQDLPTLTDLATAVNTLASTSYTPSLNLGNDPNSLNLGFLVNSSTVVTDSVTQVEKTTTYTTASSASATLWERPPLVLQAEFVRVGKNYPVTIIDAPLTPRDNIDDPSLGPDIRTHRAAQATDLSALIQAYQTAGQNVILAGNLNAFEFSDGFVDVTGILTGSPAAASAVTLYAPTNTIAALTDFATSVSTTSRYNFIERGDAVVYEHILASATVPDATTAAASLASYVSAVTQPHFTSDFDAILANDSTTPAGLTPHDGFVVAFLIPPVPTTASISSSAVNFGSVYIGASATQSVTITNTTTFTSTVNITNIAISGTNSAYFAQSSTCTSLAEGSTCTITLTFTPTAVGTRTALLTVTTDSTSDPTLTATLTGIGVAELEASASLLTFGNIDVGSSSPAQTFTLTNETSSPIAISSITISGDYTETTNCGASLPGLSTCTVSVIFTPTTTGARTGTITINHSAVTIALTGNGVDFSIAVSPTSGAVIAGDGISLTVTLTPIAGFSAPLTLTCTTTAAGTTCTPSTKTVTLSAATTDLTAITTTSQYTVIGYGGLGFGSGGKSGPWLLLLSIASAAALFFTRRRRLPRLTAAIFFLAAMGLANLGCSGKLPSQNTNPTYPGTYTYTLSATDGTLTHTAAYTLTVTIR